MMITVSARIVQEKITMTNEGIVIINFPSRLYYFWEISWAMLMQLRAAMVNNNWKAAAQYYERSVTVNWLWETTRCKSGALSQFT